MEPCTRRTFEGEKLSNKTHESTTDPEARLMRKGKGKEAKLVFMAHALMDNRHGLVSDFRLTEANGMVGEGRGAGHADADTGEPSSDNWCGQGL